MADSGRIRITAQPVRFGVEPSIGQARQNLAQRANTFMPLNISSVPRPEWTPLAQEGCVNVEGKVLLIQDNLTIALLRFEPGGMIPERSADYPTDVVCLEGGGFTGIGNEEGELSPGYKALWPADELHRLWTEDESMVALMIEHYTPGG